jgi:adenosylcobinamide kinase/adenosylcobinamide-phosphate guanylyltransferase
MASPLTLILGGARSGKSSHAEQLAAAENRPVHFLPTFNPALCPEDPAMSERIALHKARRPASWTTHESAHTNLSETIERLGNSLILIDCMTLWLSGLLAANPTSEPIPHLDALCRTLAQSPAHILCVSNELGLAPVPSNPLARTFRDLHGTMNQRLAHLAHTVEWVLAGIPVRIKPAR